MQLQIGNVTIGNGIIAIQSMTNTVTKDIASTFGQIVRLKEAGCDIVRVAVTDVKDAAAIKELKGCLPIVADIHYDYKLAIASIEAGADKIRVNPGNLQGNFHEVVCAARDYGIPIRIGANGGSVKDTISDRVTAMTNEIQIYVDECEKLGFNKLVLAAKSSNVLETVRASRIISKLGYPMHLGVTEAGLSRSGTVKSAIGIGTLLMEGIGDTIRVSLTADPVEEVYAAQEILRAVGRFDKGVEVISCPSCGRCKINLIHYAEEIYQKTRLINKPLKISVMGCAVNGVGEAKHSDIGLAGGNDEIVIFVKGEIIKKVKAESAVSEFMKELEKIL